MATEALSLGCTELDQFHRILDHPPADNATFKTTSLVDVVTQIYQDSRFNGLFHQPGFYNTVLLMQNHSDLLLEHWNAWQVTDPLQQLEQICDLSVILAIGTGNVEAQFDFFLIHLMTVAHALVVLWHEMPGDVHTAVLKEYAMFVIYVYIAQLRRSLDVDSVVNYDLNGRDWKWVVETALAHDSALDSHFFKVVCAPKAFEETYGEKSGFYLKAAVKFIAEFRGWTGFGQGTDGVDPSKL